MFDGIYIMQNHFTCLTTNKTHTLYLFRTMRSRGHDVVLVRRTINLGYWEFGMGREWGGVEKGEVSLRVT
jgi:hypothetical protein